MPNTAPRLCNCGGQITAGSCSRSCRGSAAARRGSAHSRGYGADWRAAREIKLAHDPLCQDCEAAGRAADAVEVHHLAKITDRPDLRLRLSNLRSLCTDCHARRTARGE